jgi:hypothetical protein
MKAYKLFKFTLVFAFLTLLPACSGSKKMTKKAIQLEEANMTEEAARFYLIALEKNNTNVDAQIGLNKTGQYVLNQKTQRFLQIVWDGRF